MSKAQVKKSSKTPAKVSAKASAKPLGKPSGKPSGKPLSKPIVKEKTKVVAKTAVKAVAVKPAAKAVAKPVPVVKPTKPETKPALKPVAKTEAVPVKGKAEPVKVAAPSLLGKVEKKSGKKPAEASTETEVVVAVPKVQADEPAVPVKVKGAKGKKDGMLKKLSAITDDLKKWSLLKEEHSDAETLKYNMTQQYGTSQPIVHPKLGWGFILSNNNDRLEVLFESGVKILISNYNSGR